MRIQGWFPLGWTGLISLLSKGPSRVFPSTTVLKASILQCSAFFMVIPGGSDGKESACDVGDPGLIPRSERSPGEGMATHSSILAWRIPWTKEPGVLLSMGSQRVGHERLTLSLARDRETQKELFKRPTSVTDTESPHDRIQGASSLETVCGVPTGSEDKQFSWSQQCVWGPTCTASLVRGS